MRYKIFLSHLGIEEFRESEQARSKESDSGEKSTGSGKTEGTALMLFKMATAPELEASRDSTFVLCISCELGCCAGVQINLISSFGLSIMAQ